MGPFALKTLGHSLRQLTARRCPPRGDVTSVGGFRTTWRGCRLVCSSSRRACPLISLSASSWRRSQRGLEYHSLRSAQAASRAGRGRMAFDQPCGRAVGLCSRLQICRGLLDGVPPGSGRLRGADMGIDILAVLGAIGTVLSAINGIYSFVKNADEFLSGRSDWDAVRAVISSQITIRNQILQVSGQILDAVAQLDRRIFLEHMADKLGDSDQAVLALDTWKRTGDLNQRAIALNESAGALSDVLRYSNNSVYPNESLAFPMVEVLFKRLVVLKEADPQFALSAIARQPVEDAVEFLRSTADSMSSAIEDANAIRDRSSIGTRVVTLPRSEGGGRMTVLVLHLDVSYRNLDGSVTVERRGEYGRHPQRAGCHPCRGESRRHWCSAKRSGARSGTCPPRCASRGCRRRRAQSACCRGAMGLHHVPQERAHRSRNGVLHRPAATS